MIDKCRIALTKKCNKQCSYCCMKDSSILNSFSKSSTQELLEMSSFDEYLITGGEPFLVRDKLHHLISQLRKKTGDSSKIFIYTNGSIDFKPSFEVLSKVDGLNVSLHDPQDPAPLNNILNIVKDIPVRIRFRRDLSTRYIRGLVENTKNLTLKYWEIGDCYLVPPECRLSI